MSPPYICLQGHLWAYQEQTHPPPVEEMLCPTCGLRLYSESKASSIPVRSRNYFPSDPTPPLSAADVVRLSRCSADGGDVAPIKPGDIEAIPGYELLGILGRGGMGIVFRARQLSLKRQVALKMILTGRNARPTERTRFQREAEAVARLQHSNIVQIYEIGEQNGLPYFSIEFVNAGSLAQFLNNNPHPARLCAQFVSDLANAMHYAHKRGIVHRDLKPANILLHMDESQLLKEGNLADTAILRNLLSYTPKITDFGLAKHMGGEEGPFRHGAVVGTPSYMAPEQARGTSGEVGPAADVYALGAILYEMLTGGPPFKATTPEETAQMVLTTEPIPPTQLRPKIPKDLETICLVCLQKNPAHRYGSAAALAEDLRRFLENEPILARRTALPERMVKWATRRPLLVGLSLAGLALTSLFWWVWWHRAVQIQVEKDEIFISWQKSEAQLLQAMQTIDQMAATVEPDTIAPGESPPAALIKAKLFYQRLLEQEGPPNRIALAHYRLAKIHERLGDRRAAVASYEEAISRWEARGRVWPNRSDFESHLLDCRERLQVLRGK
jgi:serine/threonine protein kinase